MKIWVTEIGEPLPLEKDVRLHRYGQFTQALSEWGHDVTWWTSSFSHAPKKFVVDKDTDVDCAGVHLKILHGPGYKKNVSLARIRHQSDFAARFLERARKESPPDIIITPIPTIEVAEKAVQLAREWNVPVVTDIRDEWPDELVNVAPPGLRWLARLLLGSKFKKMRYVCQNVDGLMAMSMKQLNYGLKFADRPLQERDFFFPLGYSQKPVAEEKMQKARAWVKELGLRPGTFTVCFFGTIGRFFDLETVIEAARRLEKEFPCQFVLAGSGSHLESYRNQAKDLAHVHFPGWIDAPKISAIMESSHVGLAPYKEGAFSLPNKPFEYFAGGLAVVSSIQGELKDILAKNNCGLTYQEGDIDGLCSTLRTLQKDSDLLRQMGKNARQLLENQFSTEKVFAEANRYLQSRVQADSAATKKPETPTSR